MKVAAEQVGVVLPSLHIYTIGPFGVMDGISRTYHAGKLFETLTRWKLGWLEPTADLTLTTPGQETTVSLTDVGANAGDGVVVVRTADPKQYFLLECRDSTATAYTDGSALAGITECQVEDAVGRSGLLILHVSEHGGWTGSQGYRCCPTVARKGIPGWWTETGQLAPQCGDPECENDCGGLDGCCLNDAFPPTIDVEDATGMIDPESWAPDPVRGFDSMSWKENESHSHQGDLAAVFGNGQSNTFTPFTNPNTNLYWFPENPEDYEDPEHCAYRRDQSIYSGLSFYNIHWTTPPGGGAGTMSVTIRYDGDDPGDAFQVPDGMVWTDDIQVMGDVEVSEGRHLQVAPGTRVLAASNQDVVGGDNQVEILTRGQLTVSGSSSEPVLWT